jgi:hypothetical protein
MDPTYPIVIGIIVYAYVMLFNSTMKSYRESDYTMSWKEFVRDRFPYERLMASFTG